VTEKILADYPLAEQRMRRGKSPGRFSGPRLVRREDDPRAADAIGRHLDRPPGVAAMLARAAGMLARAATWALMWHRHRPADPRAGL
jgi:hypothetical protein